MNVQQASSVSGRSGTTPSGIGKSLTLHDQISLTVIRPNNTKLEIMVHKKSAIMEVLSQIVPGKEETFVLEAYGVVFSRDETIADAIHKTRCGIFLLSEQSRPFPVYRDTVAAMEDSTIESRANIILKKHWEVFNHTTASLFGFATGALLQTKSSNLPSIPSNSIVSRPTSSYSEIAKMTSSHRPPSPLPSSTKYPSSSKTTSRPTIPNRKIPQTTSFASSNYASYSIAQSCLQTIQDNPNDHAQNLRLLTEFDVSEGDCSLSHLRMKRLLEADEITKKAKWQLVCAKDVHTFLCGVSITGAMFVLDVGTLKFCRRVNRVSTNVIMATYTYKEMKPAIVKVQLDNNKSTILYKVISCPNLIPFIKDSLNEGTNFMKCIAQRRRRFSVRFWLLFQCQRNIHS